MSLETGKSRTFASAVDWPGWCRGGRDEESALDSLAGFGPRYAKVVQSARLGFEPPSDPAIFSVVERLKGNATTDFGAPGMAGPSDAKQVNAAELRRLQNILKACWRTFDAAVASAEGRPLAAGPRGGGRSREQIVEHVIGADEAYLGRIGWKIERVGEKDLAGRLSLVRGEITKALVASAHGKLPKTGPRGGVYWTTRYFVRRSAWHVLDHAWEIEDRR